MRRALPELVDDARTGRRMAIARLVSLFEDTRVACVEERACAIALLNDHEAPHAPILGLTGAPGAGKSTLLAACAPRWLARDPSLRLAILAVDPSSARSGGALLGDRTRMHGLEREPRLYVRSQASHLAVGGIGRDTPAVCRVLTRLFDVVIIETVGVGQNEIAVGDLADHVALVITPNGGDNIQYMKSGVMEIPDAFIVNKCDMSRHPMSAARALHASLTFNAPDRDVVPPIVSVSAATGYGVDACVTLLADLCRSPLTPAMLTDRETRHFVQWIRVEYGRAGIRALDAMDASPAQLVARAGGVDAAQAAFAAMWPTAP